MSLSALILFTLVNFSNNNILSEPTTFVAYVSASTSADDLKALEEYLIKDGFSLDFSSIEYDKEGRLKSIGVLLHVDCKEDPYNIDTTLTLTESQPFGVILVGEKCQGGAMSVTSTFVDMHVSFFFQSSEPNRIYKAWQE